MVPRFACNAVGWPDMPMFEYLVGVTPPGGKGWKHYHRGTFYLLYGDEHLAVEKAIEIVTKRYGYNVQHEYNCVVFQLDEDET